MDFDKEFSDIYYECCCAGAAGGANCISSFTPENNKGVVDTHEKDKDLKESKMREGMGVFDMDDDGELGVGKVNVTHTIPHEKREYFPTSDVPEDDDVYEDDFGNPIFEDDDDLGYDDLQDFDDDYFETSSTLDANDYDERNDPLYGYGEDDFDFEESKAMPRAIRESRALIGGSLESKEKTDYENTLEEHNKKRSYNKTVDSIDQKLTGVDSGAHGKHEWTGELKNE